MDQERSGEEKVKKREGRGREILACWYYLAAGLEGSVGRKALRLFAEKIAYRIVDRPSFELSYPTQRISVTRLESFLDG